MTSFKDLLRNEISAKRLWFLFSATAALSLTPTLTVALQIQGFALRDNFDVFSMMMLSPVGLVIPLVAVLVSCTRLSAELGNRYIANTRSRVDVRRYLVAKLTTAAAMAFVIAFMVAFVSFVVAFYLWPQFGNPGIRPDVYMMTADEAVADSLTRTSYSFLLGFGPGVYGFLYSVWLGLGGAIYASLGAAALLVVHNRVLALSLPLLVYFTQTVGAALFEAPHLGLMYSLIPFGLQQSPPFAAAAPTLMLGIGTIALWIWLLRISRTSDRLA